jgi:hypothetical protein
VSLSSCLAVEGLSVEYKGHTCVNRVEQYSESYTYGYLFRAHAALSPWEGKNALDAAVLAYTSIAALRQQLHPTHRVHGIFEGKDWAVNSELSIGIRNIC